MTVDETAAREAAADAISNFTLAGYLEEHSAAPTATVAITLNGGAAFQRAALIEQRDRDQQVNGKSIDGSHELDEQIDALTEVVKGSTLTFHMRAVYGPEREAVAAKIRRDMPIGKGLSEEEKNERHNHRQDKIVEQWVQKAITAVVDSEGTSLPAPDSDEDMAALRAVLHDAQWKILTDKFGELSLSGDFFDAEVDAGFPG